MNEGSTFVVSAKPESQELYEYVAHQINREDSLVNSRLSWTLQINGFLFAALALIGMEMDPRLRDLLLKSLPATGFVVSLAGFTGVVAAQLAIRDLTKLWQAKLNELPWPRPFGNKWAFVLGVVPSLAPPAILAIVWAVIWWYASPQ